MKIPLLLLVLLAGCAHNQPVTQARTAIPVQCQEQIPDRPAMPTEALADDADVDAYVQAADAELKRREGYEVKLRTALEACTSPIQGNP